MRIWSIHPRFLDSKGLIALWREALLAKQVLEGRTKGYKHHPQLLRFKKSTVPLDCINHYLSAVFNESLSRGYHFDRDKINWEFKPQQLKVSIGQLEYEWKHLLSKLQTRDSDKYKLLGTESEKEVHPLFYCVEGEVEAWEITPDRRI